MVAEVKFVIDTDDEVLHTYKIYRQTQCISHLVSEGGDLPKDSSTFRQLNHMLSRIGESTDQANTLRAIEIERIKEKDEAKKDRTKKGWLHKQNKLMLKNALSPDGHEASEALSPDFLSCFNAESSGAAGKQFIYLLSKKGFKNTVISEGAINSMYHGEIVSTVPNTPKNHTLFNYHDAEPLQGSQVERFLVLHMADVNGKAKSNEEIKASMAQTFTTPMEN